MRLTLSNFKTKAIIEKTKLEALLEHFLYKDATILFLSDFLIVNIDVADCLH